MNKNSKKIKYALLSVFDKTGIESLAASLIKKGYRIISSGGTANILQKAKIPVIAISEITGNPEILDGRVKTISYQVAAGLLFERRKKAHQKTMENMKLPIIDIVICNLYPFEKVSQKKAVKTAEVIESIDVGGPTMIRAAAKNFASVVVVVDPSDYEELIKALEDKNKMKSLRQQYAAKAFTHVSYYDSLIGNYLGNSINSQKFTIPFSLSTALRYGENPHQSGKIFSSPLFPSPIASLKKQMGRELSATNIMDIAAGFEVLKLFEEPTAVIIKHANSCGIACGVSSAQALKRAIEADPQSAFGGVIVLNRPLTISTAKVVGNFKTELHSTIDVCVSTDVSKSTLKYLESVRKSIGIYTFDIELFKKNRQLIKTVGESILVTENDTPLENYKDWKFVTKLKPTKKQLQQMQFGWKCISRIKSNTIAVVDINLPMTRGIGSGQTSRVLATKIALERAGKYTKGAVLVSDSFFPFTDSIELAATYKIGAILQQGGSISDEKVIAAANKFKIPMVFTARRAFWH